MSLPALNLFRTIIAPVLTHARRLDTLVVNHSDTWLGLPHNGHRELLA
jgi:hypothetical protein